MSQIYYVSPTGQDSNSGRSSAQAWKSINEVNRRMSSLPLGSTILFERGKTFLGQLNVTIDNATIGAYGSGSQPLIRATRWLSGWTSLGGNIWQVSPPTLPERVRAVYRGRTSLPLGRHPNLSDPVHKGYFYYESVAKQGSFPKTITDNQLTSLSSEDWTGSEVTIRLNRWRLVVDTVESQSGGTLAIINQPALFLPKQRSGYFFQNSIKTLDEQDEWAYDRAAGKLYLYSTTNPNTQSYSYASNDYAVQVDQASGVRVENLTLMGSNQAALGINQSNNATVEQVTIDPSGYFGIHAEGSSGVIITNAEIRNTNLEGIRVESNSPNPVIKDCLLENIAMTAGMGQADGDGYSGMYIIGDGGIIEGNTIRRTGYCGMRVDMSSGLVKRNLIEEICFVKDDGGGIYVNDNSQSAELIVEENIVRKAIGNGLAVGTDQTDKVEFSHGIYLDVNSINVLVRHNTVSGAKHGFFMKNVDKTFIGNTMYNNADFGIQLLEGGAADKIANAYLADNVIVGRGGNGLVKFQSDLDEATGVSYLAQMGQVVGNYFVYPVSSNAKVIKLRYRNAQSVDYTSAEANATFNSFSGNQTLAITAPQPEPANWELFFDNPSDATISRSLPSGKTYTDAKGQLYSGEVEIAPWRSVVLFQTTAASPSVTAVSKVNGDAEETLSSKVVQLTSADLDMRSTDLVGLRFALAVPPGAIIEQATLRLTGKGNQSGNNTLTVRVQNANNANAFSATAGNLSSRSTGTASVNWGVGNWQDGQSYTSPNLSSLVQQVVNRSGWQSGNHVAFLIQGSSTSKRSARSYEYSNSNQFSGLSITYRLPGGASARIPQGHNKARVDEAAAAGSLLLYPNPAREVLQVQGAAAFSYELYDERGVLVGQSREPQHSFALEVSGLQRGLYLLRTVSQEEVVTRKVLIE